MGNVLLKLAYVIMNCDNDSSATSDLGHRSSHSIPCAFLFYGLIRPFPPSLYNLGLSGYYSRSDNKTKLAHEEGR